MRSDLRSLLDEIMRELEYPEAQRDTQAPTSDLQMVAGVLEEAIAAGERGDVVQAPVDWSRAVIDGWSLTSPLSARVVDFAQRYGSE